MPTPSLTRAELARQLLLYKMKEYSDDFYCAGWIADLEFELWFQADSSAQAEENQSKITPSKECRQLGELAGAPVTYIGNGPEREQTIVVG